MKVLVCGGRDFGNTKEEDLYIKSKIDRVAIENSEYYDPYDNWMPLDIEIISGMARGADRVAADWAICNWCTLHEFPAEWDKYGKSAGYKRNAQMLEEGKPDLVLAFPGGKGTKMMVDLATKAGVEVISYE